MSIRNAWILSGESGNIASEPCSTTGNVSVSSYLPRANASSTRGGGYCMRFSPVTSDSYFFRTFPIPWEEFIIEWAVKKSGIYDNCSAIIRSDDDLRCLELQVTTSGAVRHNVGGYSWALTHGVGTQQGISGAGIVSTSGYTFLSSHIRIASGTAGFMTTWADSLKTPLLSNTGINTQGNSVTGCGQIYLAGERANYIDDVVIRPRCILVDGVTSGTPTSGGTIAVSGGASADVYAWQSATSDSESGDGDASLASGEYRLFLRNTSFSVTATTGGFADDATVTVSGLTGTIKVNAPASNYAMGLEPGGQLFGSRLFIERPALNAAGTDDTDGTVTGASTRLLALQSATDSKTVDHTADDEKVSCAVAALSDPSEIGEIVSVVGYVRASSNASSPDAVQVRLLDSGTEMLGPKVALGSSQTVLQHAFDTDAAGGQWSTGTGSGGTDDMEPSYKTGTT